MRSMSCASTHVSTTHDTPQGWEGAQVLASGGVGAVRWESRSKNGCATGRVGCRRACAGTDAGAADHRTWGPGRAVRGATGSGNRAGATRSSATRTRAQLWGCLAGVDAVASAWIGCSCAERIPEGREKIPWATMAAILVIARLCEPSSELHIAEDWYRRTALDDLLGVPVERGQRRPALSRAGSACCRTSRRSRPISSAGSASCSRSTTTCCSTT